MHQLWGIFVVPSARRLMNPCDCKDALSAIFFTTHARSRPSPLEPSTNSEPIEPTQERKVRVGEEDEERNKDVDLPDASHILPLMVHWHLNATPRILRLDSLRLS